MSKIEIDKSQGINASLLSTLQQSPARVLAPIYCDDMCYEPPKGLQVGGFPLITRKDAGSNSWEIDENLLDTVVAWSALGNAAKTAEEKIESIIEIDYRDEIPFEDIVHMAASGEFSLSLVGVTPSSSKEELALYASNLKALATIMLKFSNFSKSLYPFSNEFEAIFLERMGKKDDALLMRSMWSKGMADLKHPSGARVEYALKRTALGNLEVKEACYQALLDHFGSDESITTAVKSLARPIAKRIGKFADEVKAQPKAKQDRFKQVTD